MPTTVQKALTTGMPPFGFFPQFTPPAAMKTPEARRHRHAAFTAGLENGRPAEQ